MKYKLDMLKTVAEVDEVELTETTEKVDAVKMFKTDML